jgi:phosphoribosylanthranilate isomerase
MTPGGQGRVRVKVCGLTHEEDVQLCLEEGADAIGFVVEYPRPVPWNLGREPAATLARLVPPFVTRVAVVGGDAEAILSIARAVPVDALQLHFDEAEETVARLARELRGTSIRLVKALRLDPQERPAPSALRAEACRFMEAGASAILFDSKSDERAGGTGKTLAWDVVAEASRDASWPVILAGGLTPQNAGAAIAQVRPWAVDVISSVEDARHRKVRAAVRAFIAAAKGPDAAG